MFIKLKNDWLKTVTVICFCCATNTAAIAANEATSHVKVDAVAEMVLGATTELNATLHSRAHVGVTAGVNGRLTWLAQPGDYLQQGEVMVKMDLIPLQLQKAEQGAELKREQINLAYLKNELSRLEKLIKTKATSQFTLDQTRSKVALAHADIVIAQLKFKQIEDQLTRATIKAPFSGVITQRMARAGSDVNRSDVLLKLLDTEHLEARLFVPVKYLAFVKKGSEVSLRSVGQTINAKVSAKIPSADPRSQTFEVRITLPEQLNEVWAAGQLVRVKLPIQHANISLTVDRDALILRKEGTFVVKIDEQNKVHRLPVIVGKGNLTRVSVQGDLQHGDKVAIRGAERLSEGQSVTVQ
jgi:RND family efflux transporter MFP subunit